MSSSSRSRAAGRSRRILARACLLASSLIAPALALPAATGAASATPALLYATFAGNAATSVGTGIGTDHAGNLYVAGSVGVGTAARAFVSKYDPTGSRLLYTTYINAPCGAFGNALAVDAAGNAYVTGQYGVKNQFGICQEITDVLAAKLDPAGHVVYQKAIGPTAQDGVLMSDNNQGEAIAVDGMGSVYITGLADGDPLDPHIPISANALQRTGHGHDGFALKLDAAGNVSYCTFLGGSSLVDEGKGIAVDAAGDAYVTGTTQSADFPVSPNAYQPHLGKRFNITNFLGNAFIAELNPTGTKLLYGSYLGGGEVEIGYAIATDGAGNVYVTGATASPNFPTTPSAYDRTCGTDGNCNVRYTCLVGGCGDIYQDDVFVVKIAITKAGAAALRYSTFLGGNFNDEGEAIAVDRAGHIYVAGRNDSPAGFPARAAIQPQASGADAFVAALDPSRTGAASLLFSTDLGGSKDDEALAMALGKGSIYVTGDTASPDFPTHAPLQKSWTGKYGAFVAKLSR